MIITASTVIAIVPAALILGILLAALRGDADARAATLAAMVTVLVLIAGAGAVIRQTFGVVLYRYASTGTAAGASRRRISTPRSARVCWASVRPPPRKTAPRPDQHPGMGRLCPHRWRTHAGTRADQTALQRRPPHGADFCRSPHLSRIDDDPAVHRRRLGVTQQAAQAPPARISGLAASRPPGAPHSRAQAPPRSAGMRLGEVPTYVAHG